MGRLNNDSSQLSSAGLSSVVRIPLYEQLNNWGTHCRRNQRTRWELVCPRQTRRRPADANLFKRGT